MVLVMQECLLVQRRIKGKKAAQASSNATVQKTVKSSQIPTQSSQIGAPGSDAGQAGLVQQLDTLFSNVIKIVTQGDSAANGSNREKGPGN
ncbi:hypothetical protein SESBI_32147 [Sesbania bispinosa]|nr:hypothetical protein SESBI_32147 [Sesbania bispinosa]